VSEKMIMYFLLKAAIKRKELEAVKILLQGIDQNLLIRFSDEDASVVNELATYGLLDAIKEARKINPLLLSHHSIEGRTGFTEAICFNQPHVVNYLISLGLFTYPTPLHKDAYLGKLKPTTVICIEKTTAKDSAGRVPLFYAVAGGHQEAVTALLAVTPGSAVDVSELLRVSVVARHQHLLPLLASSLKLEDCSPKNVGLFLIAIREFVDEPIALINQLLANVPADLQETLERLFIVEAIKGEGHHALAECMMKRYKPSDKSARAALLHDLTNVLASPKTFNPTYELNIPVDDNVFLGFADDLASQPELLHKVLTKFIVTGYEEGVRSVWRTLPEEIITRVVTDEEKKYPVSLAELAKKYQRKVAYFSLCHYDQSDKNEHELKEFFHHEISFYQLMTEFRRTRNVEVEKAKKILEKLNALRITVLKTDEDAKGTLIAGELNYCISEIWKTVSVFCGDEREKENLKNLLNVVLAFLKLNGLPVSVFHFCRASHLAFALGEYEEAKKLYDFVTRRFTQDIIGQREKEEKDPIFVAQAATARVTIAVLLALKVNVEPHLQRDLMQEWIRTCNVFFVGDSALLQTEPPVFNEERLQLAFKSIPDSALPSVKIKKLSQEDMELLFCVRNAMLIKSNIVLFREWLNKHEKTVAKSIPRDIKKLSVLQVTSGNREQISELLSFYAFKTKLMKYFLQVMSILKTYANAPHMTYELPDLKLRKPSGEIEFVSYQKELDAAVEMVAFLTGKLNIEPVKEKERKQPVKKDTGQNKKDAKEKKEDESLSDDETDEKMPGDEVRKESKKMPEDKKEKPIDSVKKHAGQTFFKSDKKAAAKQPSPQKKKSGSPPKPTVALPLLDFIVKKEEPKLSEPKPALVTSIRRFKIEDENFKVPAPVRHFFEYIGPGKIVMAGSCVPYLIDNRNKKPRDYDTVYGDTMEALKELVKAIGATLTENPHGIRKSYQVTYEGVNIDVTLPHGSPAIPFRWRLNGDAKNRDVTIRAMFYDPFAQDGERIIDDVKGQIDIARNHVALADPSKLDTIFISCPKEILRIIRLVGQGRTIEESIVEAIKKNKEGLHQVDGNVIEKEIKKIFDDMENDLEKINALLARFELDELQPIEIAVKKIADQCGIRQPAVIRLGSA
jgi:tRNA nucleotidyltransferase/poly(A) polymerase